MTTLMKIFCVLDTNDTLYLALLIIIAVIILAFVAFIFLLIKRSIRHTCEYCYTNKTSDTDNNGRYQCYECSNNLLIKEAMQKEKIRKCPDCSIDMNKEIIDETDIIADVCPNCGGMFLDKNELEELQDQLGINEITFSPAKIIVTTQII